MYVPHRETPAHVISDHAHWVTNSEATPYVPKDHYVGAAAHMNQILLVLFSVLIFFKGGVLVVVKSCN